MPAGYETAYGTYDVTINTLFLNTAILGNAPKYEVLFYLFHELRHAMQYLRPIMFDDKIKESINYVILSLLHTKKREKYAEIVRS